MGRTFAKSFFLTFIVLCMILAAAVAYLQFSPYVFAMLEARNAVDIELTKPFLPDEPVTQNRNPGLAQHIQTEADSRAGRSQISKAIPEWLYEQKVIARCPWRSQPHFVADNFDEYLRFAQTRSLDPDTIMWMVNSNSHIPHYSNIYTDHSAVPLLINRNHRLPPSFRPPGMVRIRTADWIMLIPEAEEAFERMRLAALADGFTIRAASGFRSAARQEELLYGRPRPNIEIATPYHSEHQTGRAIDVQNRFGEFLHDCADAGWVARNAHNFGFIIRYTEQNSFITGFISEPWHLTYVGIEIATHMIENNIMSLEEFVGRNPGVQFGWRGER